MSAPQPGTVGWTDLTVDHADRVRDFYVKVVGWKPQSVEMGGYADYAMVAPATKQMVAGVCWKRGVNADLPSQWLIYITVKQLKSSLAACIKLGGELLVGPRALSGGRVAVIRDPAGAVCALFEPPRSAAKSKASAKSKTPKKSRRRAKR